MFALPRLTPFRLQVLEEGCVPRDEFEQALHRRNLEFLNTKADVETHSRNNVVERNAFIEQVARELAAISQSSSDQVAALKAESSLEVSLEKSKLKTALMRAALDMQDLRNTIDIGSSNALADLAKLRNDIFYSALGTVRPHLHRLPVPLGFFCTSVAAFLGYLRYCS